MIDKKPTVSYFEKRTVNIGNYESVDFCLTISGVSVETKGFGNKSVSISAGEKQVVENTIEETALALIKKVQKISNAIECKIRLQTADWAGIGFDTESKAVIRKVVPKDYEFENHFGKRMNLEDE